jgi:transposase
LYGDCGILRAGEYGYNKKKKQFTYSEKSEEKRDEYISQIKRVPEEKRVYLDESGINTFLQREYARAPRGVIIEDVKRGVKFERFNVIGAQCNENYYAVECYKQNTNSEFFEAWFELSLLEEIPKGTTIILDNASFHREKVLRKLARGKARLLFLPPYSPDYNPIEKTWANMKRFVSNNIKDYQSLDSAVYDYFGL